MKSGVPVLLVLAIVAIGLSTPSSSFAAQDGKTCADFDFQEEAQEYFEAGGGRPTDTYIGMDGNDNGIACESLPRQPHADSTLSTFIAPTAVTAAVVVGGILWTRRRDASNAESC